MEVQNKKMPTALSLQLIDFMKKYSEICSIILQQYQEEYLNAKVKISGKNFANFLNCVVHRPNQTLRINPPATMRAQLDKTSDRVIHFDKEIPDINKY